MDILQIQINNLQSLITKLNEKNKGHSARINELNTKIERLNSLEKPTDIDKTLREQYYDLISKYENQIATNYEKITEMETKIDEIRFEKSKRVSIVNPLGSPPKVVEEEKNLEKKLGKLEPSIDVSPEELESLMETEGRAALDIPQTTVAPNVIPESVRPEKIIPEEKEDETSGPEILLGTTPLITRPLEKIESEEETIREEEIPAESARLASILTQKKIRKDAIRRMIEEERKEKRKKKKSRKNKLAKPYKIKVSDEYSRKITKEQAEKIAIEKMFRTTLIQTKKIDKSIPTNSNVTCKAILKSGKNMTKKKYYLPSQFPNLTKLKPNP